MKTPSYLPRTLIHAEKFAFQRHHHRAHRKLAEHVAFRTERRALRQYIINFRHSIFFDNRHRVLCRRRRKHAPNAKTLLIGSAEEYAVPEGNAPLKETDPLEASNPYGISKIAQENFAQLYRKKYGMKIVCTRSFNHTGVGQTTTFALPSFVKQVAEIHKSGKPGKIFVGNLSAFRDFSDVEDVVHVYRMLLENENEYDTYNVGSGIAHKIEDLLKNVILKFTPVEIEIVVDPAKVRPVETPYLCADNSRIKKYWRGTDIKVTLQKMFDRQ